MSVTAVPPARRANGSTRSKPARRRPLTAKSLTAKSLSAKPLGAVPLAATPLSAKPFAAKPLAAKAPDPEELSPEELSPQVSSPKALTPKASTEQSPAAESATLTVTVQITVHGGELPVAAAQMLRDLRELAVQLDDATVSLAPAAACSIVDTADPAVDMDPATEGDPAAGRRPRLVAVRRGAEGVPTAAEPRLRLRPPGPDTTRPDVRIVPASRTVLQDDQSVPLTRREFDLLLFLAEHPRRVFSRDQLLAQVWGYEWVGGSRTVDVHIRRLRIKLGRRGPVVCTVHGVGYRLDDDLQLSIEYDPE